MRIVGTFEFNCRCSHCGTKFVAEPADVRCLSFDNYVPEQWFPGDFGGSTHPATRKKTRKYYTACPGCEREYSLNTEYNWPPPMPADAQKDIDENRYDGHFVDGKFYGTQPPADWRDSHVRG